MSTWTAADHQPAGILGNKMKGYTELNDLLRDLEFIENNPNDHKFLSHVALKVDASDDSIRDELIKHLEEDLMIREPVKYLAMLSNRLPKGFYVVLKDNKDPWFSC